MVDLNLPDMNWDSLTVIGNQSRAAFNNGFPDALRNCGLRQMVIFSSRKSMPWTCS